MNNDLKNINMVILCGGRGSRMGKLTKKIPKPMIKAGKLSIIEHKIKYYKSQGVEKFIFCLGYKASVLKKFLQKKIRKVFLVTAEQVPEFLKEYTMQKNI